MSEQQFEAVVVPAPNLIMGHLSNFAEDNIGAVQQYAQYGDFVRIRAFNVWINLIYHPDLVQDLLVKKAKFFNKPQRLKDLFRDINPDNMFAADGERWKSEHKLIMPAFHAQRIGEYADTMVEYTKRATTNWQSGTKVNMDEVMMAVTMRIITKTMLNMELPDDVTEIEEVVENMFAIFGDRINQAILAPKWMPTKQNRQMAHIRKSLNSLMQGAINHWREVGEDRGDLLSMLMLSTYEDGSKMDDANIINELILMFAAGHETTAHTLAYTFYALATHPEIKATLQNELDTVLRGKPPTLANIRDLTYTDMVIKEAMRMYPVAQGAIREPNQDTDICGIPIKMGEIVTAPSWAIHHDERWYPNPHIFDPERFNSENEKNIPKYAYIPFGGGPRVCIGNQFAMLEARMVLATIMQQFDVAIDADYVLKPTAEFTTKPAGGLPMTITIRDLSRWNK